MDNYENAQGQSLRKTHTNMLKRKIRIFLFFLIVIVAAIIAVSFFVKINKSPNPQEVSKRETSDLVGKVSKLIVLPVGETPTIATVSDPIALRDQPFFAQAEKGDKVLIYAQAKKAILYSVTLNKILEVTTLSIDPTKSGTKQ